ncbi:MAG: phosphoglucomutase/phosphomannomutase family protein [Collinsella sp.]|nr:phosphoglucomutase/phosphomannomutase family protein [Collinsella sp.]
MGAIIHFETDGWFVRDEGGSALDGVSRIADAVARCWASSSPGSTVHIAYDARPSARSVAEVAAAIVASHGLDAVISDRVAPTAALSKAVMRDAGSCGGLVITGAHYPDDYLGVKIRVADGGMGTRDFMDEVERIIELDPTEARGTYRVENILDPYLEELIARVDADAIAGAGLKVVCDPMYGSARGCLAKVLRRLGVEVHEIHAMDDTGRVDLRPKPIEPWVDDCEQAVEACGAVAGLATDGDANFMGAVDEEGRYVGADKIAALILGHLVRERGMGGKVVLSVAASTTIKRAAQALGCPVVVRPLGFRYIYDEIKKGGALLGTEGFGGICVQGGAPERDGMLACLLLCELMARTGKGLKALVQDLEEQMGSMSYGRRDLRMPVEDVEMLSTMMPGMNPGEVAGMEPVSVSHMDGLRLEFADGSWVLMRPSRTEPLVRVYVEAGTVELRDELAEAACEIARRRAH